MEPIGSVSRPSKDPEVNIETWFNLARLEMFAANFENVPSLWHSQHIDCDGVDPRTADYMKLLDSLEEPCTGEPRARVACAKSLCRVFCRLLRQKLRWAATKSLVDGTGEEKALYMLPYWARQAERYMRYLPLIYLNTEAELKTKAEKAARTQSNKEKKAQELKSRTQAPSNLTALYSRDSFSKKKNTYKQQAKTKKPSSASQESSSNSAKNKGSRPIPALVPLSAPKPKPSSQYSAGRHLMQRVVCGMRRAAKIYGLGRKAASVVAKEIGNQEQEVHALWSSMRVLAKAKLAALLARGDGRAKSETAHLSCLDWAVADLMMMYDYSPVQESSFVEYKQQLALLATFHLVQRFGLEAAPALPPQRWHEAARWYCKTGVVMSPVGLQRRWHEMKQHTRRKLRAHLGGDKSSPIQPLHRAIANRYPHVVTGRLTPWHELLATDLVARPTNERGSAKKRQPTATNNESTDNDSLLGDQAEASAEKNRVPSVRPGTSRSMAVIDNALAQVASRSEISSHCTSEESSDHVHRNETKNKHYENTRGGGYKKNIDGNKEVMELDALSTGIDKLEKRQVMDDVNVINIDTKVVQEEDRKNNIVDSKEITDLDALSAGPDKFERRQVMNDVNVINIDTEVAKEEDYKNNIDDSKEITDLDAPCAELDELDRFQVMDEKKVFNIETEEVTEEDCKTNTDDNKEITDLDAPSSASEELKRRQVIDDRNVFNIDTEEVKEEDCKYNIDDNKEITDLDASSAELDELDKNAFNIGKEKVKEKDNKNNTEENKKITDLDDPSAEPDKLERLHIMDDRNVINIDTEEVKEEDCKNNMDKNKEITDLDAPSAEPDELKRRQELDDINAFKIGTVEVKEDDNKSNIDGNKVIIDLDAPSSTFEELKRRQRMDDKYTVNIDSTTVMQKKYKNNIDTYKKNINLDSPSAKSNEFKSRQGIVVKDTVDGKIASKANNVSGDDFATQVIRAIEKELFYDRGINLSSESSSEKKSNYVHTNEKNRHNENTIGQSHKNNIEIIDLDAPSAKSYELERRQRMGDIIGFNIVKQIVENKIASKANATNSDDFATQVIRAIEKDIFCNRSSKLSKNNVCNTAQICANVSNSKIQPSSIEKTYDGIEKVTSSGQTQTDNSNSNVTDATNKHPMLSQMLKTVCIFDDDSELTAILNKNKEVYQKSSSSNTDVSISTNVHKHEMKSAVEIGNRKRVSNDCAQGIVVAVKKQRLESAKLENPQICKFINEETSRDSVDESNEKIESHGSISDALRKTSSSDPVIDLDSGDEVYKGCSDDEDAFHDSEIAVDSVDPKLLMYPVVVMTRFENDPSLRIIPNPSSLSTSRPPSPNLSNIKLESPSPPDIKLEKLDDRDTCNGDTPFSANTPMPEVLHEKTRALLKLCKPCVVLLERLEDVDKGLGRLAKRVELQDIDEVRRTNRRVLTAQVAPLAQDSETSSTDSCDSDWTPGTDDTQKTPTNENSDSTSDSDYEPLKPAKAKNIKNPEDDLKQLLNDFVDSPADAECCRRTKKTGMRGDLKTTAALAMELGCARCLWQLLSAPPTSALEAQLQRRLLRHTVLQATSTASAVTEIPKQKPSGTKEITKQITGHQSEKRPLPAPPVPHPDNAATVKQNQRISSAVASPIPEPGRIYVGTKTRLEPRRQTLPKNPTRRGSEPISRPEVGDINKKLGKPVEDKPPAPATGGFDPIITSVLSLAPPQPRKIRKTPETIKLLQRKLAPAAPTVVKILQAPPQKTQVPPQKPQVPPQKPQVPLQKPQVPPQKPQAPPKKAQAPPKKPQANNVRQAEPVAISLNVPGSSTNYVPIPSNGAQPQINMLQPHNVAQYQNSQFDRNPTQSVNMLDALQSQTQQETPQYLPGATHWPPIQTVGQMGSQNFALPELGNVMIHHNTLAGNVMDPQGLQNAPWNNQGNIVVKQETSAFQPVLRVNSNQLNPMHINPNQSNPRYIQQNQPNPMCVQSNQPNPMCIQSNQSNSLYIQPNQPIPMHINQNQPNLMHVNQNQPNSMYIQPNQPNQMYSKAMYTNQPNPMSFNPNQSNPIYSNQMFVNPNQPNPMFINSNQPNSIYSNQIYINQNQPNPMHINPNQPNSIYTTPVHINQNQSNPMYINQNQLNLINPGQNQPISIGPSQMPIKTEPASSYLPPTSHPNPYGAGPGYSSNVPMLENSTPTGLSQTYSFSPMNAGSLQTSFNSMQESQSFQRLQPSYDEAVSMAGPQQASIQVYEQTGSSQVNASQPLYAVEFKIGYCNPGSELYTKINSYARLKWYSESAVASHEWVAGREESSLAVLCTGAYRHPWALLGQFLVLSQEEMPPPNFDVWALNPRVRLLLPHETSNQMGLDCDATPSRLKVKAFAKEGQSEAEVTQEWKTGTAPRRLAYAKIKLSENPLVYAKLLVAISSANSCRFLLKRGGAIQLYCIQTCELYPIHAKPSGPDSQFSLTGESALLPALRELARQLQGDEP